MTWNPDDHDDDVKDDFETTPAEEEDEGRYGEELITDFEWVIVAENTGQIQAMLIKIELEEAGIPVILKGEQINIMPVAPVFDTKIWVPKRYLEIAQEIVDEFLARDDDDIVCSNCGAVVSESDPVCPECGAKFYADDDEEDEVIGDTKWVKIGENISGLTANLLKQQYEAMDIPVEIKGGDLDTVQIYPGADTKVFVPAQFAEQARIVLNDMTATDVVYEDMDAEAEGEDDEIEE